jgi:hypothetical protein
VYNRARVHRRLLFLLLSLGPFTEARAAGPESSAAQADPWATVRGCSAVLERFVTCASDPAVRALKPRWVALADPGKKVAARDIEALLRGWTKPDERRRQCAVWSKRDGAPAHIGEASPLAKLAPDRSATCTRFAQEISDDGWLPKAIVDAAAPAPAPAR